MFDRLLRQGISLITVVAIFFLAAIALVLLVYAVVTVAAALFAGPLALENIFLALALVIVAVGVADLSLTIYQEEIVRRAAMRAAVVSADTVARFLFVIITIIAIHDVLLVVRSEVQRDLQGSLVAAGLIVATAILVVAAGFYQRGIAQSRQAGGAPGRRGPLGEGRDASAPDDAD